MKCPKCNFELIADETECMKCGVVFDKYHAHLHRKYERSRSDHHSREFKSPKERTEFHVMESLKEFFLFVRSDVNPLYFAGRAIVFLAVFLLGLKFILTPMEVVDTGKRVLHLINLPFHEAGHILFRPFGRFMMVMGGSLLQLVIPLICLVVFLVKSRDTFAASITLWWFGESLTDLAPYINDARQMRIILLGGITGRDDPDMHDWHIIFRDLNLLRYDHLVAEAVHLLGIVMMLITILWGGYLLFKQSRNMEF